MRVHHTYTLPAGHDQFLMELVAQVLGRRDIYDMKEVFCCEWVLNMTFLAANLSHYINGVAKRHGEISRHMFSRYVIDAITNGVHASLYDKLENAVIPLYYNNRDQFAEVMRHCIALNGSFFNTHRMLQQYIQKAYFI